MLNHFKSSQTSLKKESAGEYKGNADANSISDTCKIDLSADAKTFLLVSMWRVFLCFFKVNFLKFVTLAFVRCDGKV